MPEETICTIVTKQLIKNRDNPIAIWKGNNGSAFLRAHIPNFVCRSKCVKNKIISVVDILVPQIFIIIVPNLTHIATTHYITRFCICTLPWKFALFVMSYNISNHVYDACTQPQPRIIQGFFFFIEFMRTNMLDRNETAAHTHPLFSVRLKRISLLYHIYLKKCRMWYTNGMLL